MAARRRGLGGVGGRREARGAEDLLAERGIKIAFLALSIVYTQDARATNERRLVA